MTVVGVLADTHGLLDAGVCEAFREAGVSHIIHAGDICDGRPSASRLALAALLDQLREIAPVTAVRGNTDDKWCPSHGLPSRASVAIDGVRFFIHHGDDPSTTAAPLVSLRPECGWLEHDVIISGHSHKPSYVRHGATGVRLLNPGSAGPKRFHLPRQCALVRIGAPHEDSGSGASGTSGKRTSGDAGNRPDKCPGSALGSVRGDSPEGIEVSAVELLGDTAPLVRPWDESLQAITQARSRARRRTSATSLKRSRSS